MEKDRPFLSCAAFMVAIGLFVYFRIKLEAIAGEQIDTAFGLAWSLPFPLDRIAYLLVWLATLFVAALPLVAINWIFALAMAGLDAVRDKSRRKQGEPPA